MTSKVFIQEDSDIKFLTKDEIAALPYGSVLKKYVSVSHSTDFTLGMSEFRYSGVDIMLQDKISDHHLRKSWRWRAIRLPGDEIIFSITKMNSRGEILSYVSGHKYVTKFVKL